MRLRILIRGATSALFLLWSGVAVADPAQKDPPTPYKIYLVGQCEQCDELTAILNDQIPRMLDYFKLALSADQLQVPEFSTLEEKDVEKEIERGVVLAVIDGQFRQHDLAWRLENRIRLPPKLQFNQVVAIVKKSKSRSADAHLVIIGYSMFRYFLRSNRGGDMDVFSDAMINLIDSSEDTKKLKCIQEVREAVRDKRKPSAPGGIGPISKC